MMGPSHRIFGALFGATYASLARLDTAEMIAATIISTTMSFGASSPDMDQLSKWKKFATATGMGWLLAHRHLTHWWGLPLFALWPLLSIDESSRWVFWALWLGWVSHLVGDFIFGKLPMLPWGKPYIGLGLDTDGWLESGFAGMKFSILRTVMIVGLVAVCWFRPVAPEVVLPGWIPFVG